MWALKLVIAFVHHCGIGECCDSIAENAVCLVDVAEKMQLRVDLFNPVKQFR